MRHAGNYELPISCESERQGRGQRSFVQPLLLSLCSLRCTLYCLLGRDIDLTERVQSVADFLGLFCIFRNPPISRICLLATFSCQNGPYGDIASIKCKSSTKLIGLSRIVRGTPISRVCPSEAAYLIYSMSLMSSYFHISSDQVVCQMLEALS